MTTIGRRIIPALDHDVFSWQMQAGQYDHLAPVAGIRHWAVPAARLPIPGYPIDCLLHYDAPVNGGSPWLTGILNRFPLGSPCGDEPGDVMVIVAPIWRRRGIGRALLLDAVSRWGVDLTRQVYTPAGLALARATLAASWVSAQASNPREPS